MYFHVMGWKRPNFTPAATSFSHTPSPMLSQPFASTSTRTVTPARARSQNASTSFSPSFPCFHRNDSKWTDFFALAIDFITTSKNSPFLRISHVLPSATVPRESPASEPTSASTPASHFTRTCGSRWCLVDQSTRPRKRERRSRTAQAIARAVWEGSQSIGSVRLDPNGLVSYFRSEQRITSEGVGSERQSRLSPGDPCPWAGGTFIRSRGASCEPGPSISPYGNISAAVHVWAPSVTETRTV